MSAFYRGFRRVAWWLLQLFYRIEVNDPAHGLSLAGAVIFIGNHPNGLVDPGLVFALSKRPVTFLAKAPLFQIPVLGLILKGMGALPVFRKKDDPTQTAKNSGTLEASAQALVGGGAITIFPEGISHGEPQLQELKTGAARIALMAAKDGAEVRVVPVGLTYSEKNRFRSIARLDVGAPLQVSTFVPKPGDDEREATQRLTDAMADSLRAVTLNLEQWEDLPLLKTAESLYALKANDDAGDPERLRRFARGMVLLRQEQPTRFFSLKSQLLSLRRRLELTTAKVTAVEGPYTPTTVASFVVRNLLALTLTPLFLLGMLLFAIPFWVPPTLVKLAKVEVDTQATVKVLTLMLLAPFWLALLTALAWWRFGALAGVVTLLGAMPLALFTRYFYERRAQAFADARTFFVLMSRRALKERLAVEANALATEVEAVANELRDRVAA